MSDVTPPDQPAVETFEPVEIEEELQRSYIDYAMSVIVGRALPHVRDGLKPVHRRILFSMWEGGMRAGTQHRKSAAAVGDVMKKYHPHGDSSIYDALVRMAQPWAIRYPLIQGHGNFGSVDGDPPAAMRYCVTGDTRVRLADGSHQRIDSLAGDRSGTDLDLDLKVENHLGEPVRATRWFDSGFHDVHEVTTREGFRLRATENHPLLVATAPLGVPMLSWKLVTELKPGDRVVLRRGTSDDVAHVDEDTYLRGTRLGKESHDKRIPESVWQGSPGLQRVFLQSLFTGDGSRSILGGNAIQISYSTRSDQLARDVQTMVLAFGMVMRRVDHACGEIKLVVSNRREARLFASRIGFMGDKQQKLLQEVAALPPPGSTAKSNDTIPFISEYVRAPGVRPWVHTDWLRRHNVDRRERWDTDSEGVRARIHDPEMLRVIEPLIDPGNYYAEVTAVEHLGLKPVYSLRVDSGDHAFVTDGFVSHNTEARLSPLAMELLRDIEEDTVEFVDSYDGSEEEPVVLPSRFPNLLVNGSAGIAVGMATNVAPHNLNEIIDAIVAQIADPDIDLDQLMEIVPGPDFPTGALIMGVTPIREAYETGRGSIRMRAIVEVEESATGERLVATELPYQVNKANLAVKIAELVKSGRLGGIRDIRDESNRQGNRLVIELKRDANAQVVLNQLYKMTQLQDTFGVINLSLVSTDTDEQSHTGVPRTMGLKDTIAHYITHQIQIITRRTQYRLRKARARSHVLEGLIVALDNLDDVIALIRNSASADDALGELQQRYELSEIQARAILDLPLRRLAALERQRIQEEYAELQARIVELEGILADPQKIRNIIVEELTEIRDKFGDARRTRILPGEGDLDIEDLIPEEQMVVTITQGGYIKRVKATEYRTQRRGGKGISAGGLKDEDIIWDLFSTSTHHWVLFFTSTGRMHRIKAWQIPEKSRTARGVYLANVPGLELEKDEFVRTIVHLENLQEEGRYLLFTTRNGIVKRTRLEEYDSPRSTLIAIGLRDGDELIDVRLTNGTDEVLLVSKKAQSIRFVEDDARPMGRGASGVKGMDLADDDEVLACAIAQEEGYLVVITDEGFGKRTPLERYPSQKRGGKGVKTARLSDNRGGLVGALVAGYEQEILVVTDKGTIIRMDVKDVRPTGRATQGVRIMSTAAGAKVVSVAKVMELQVLELEGDADDDQDE